MKKDASAARASAERVVTTHQEKLDTLHMSFACYDRYVSQILAKKGLGAESFQDALAQVNERAEECAQEFANKKEELANIKSTIANEDRLTIASIKTAKTNGKQRNFYMRSQTPRWQVWFTWL